MKTLVVYSALLLSSFSAFAQDQKNAAIEQELKTLSKDWMIATKNRDAKTLNKIVAPEFTLGGNDYDKPTISREIWMKNTLENLKIDSVHYINMQVNVIDNVAIVHSTFYWSVAFGEMPARKDTVNLVDTWMKRGQGWQVVNRLIVEK